MIEVLIEKEGDWIAAIRLKGHAGYADRGSDIVCAGVSACFLGGLKAIGDQSLFRMDYSEGEGEIAALKEPSRHDKDVLEVMSVQLGLIASGYPGYVVVKVLNERKTRKWK